MKKSMTVAQAGKLGGKARAKKLSPERRSEIARQGYNASLGRKQSKCHVPDNGENKNKEKI